MDKYQKNLIEKITFNFESKCGVEKIEVNDSISLQQNENYKVAGYKLTLISNLVSNVLYNNKKFSSDGNKAVVDIDFENTSDFITLEFCNSLADDCKIPLVFVKSNKEKYDKKVKEQNYYDLLNKMALQVAEGNNLINLYWMKASDEVTASIIKLFYIVNDKEYFVCEEKTEAFYKSITGLAFGTYKVYVEEVDANGNSIVKSEFKIGVRNYIAELKASLHEKRGPSGFVR